MTRWRAYDFDAYGGKLYRVFEGTVLEGVVTNHVDGGMAGPVLVMLTTDYYSHDHQQLLLPQGTRLIGQVQAVNNRSSTNWRSSSIVPSARMGFRSTSTNMRVSIRSERQASQPRLTTAISRRSPPPPQSGAWEDSRRSATTATP